MLDVSKKNVNILCHAFDRFQFGDFSNKQNRDINSIEFYVKN